MATHRRRTIFLILTVSLFAANTLDLSTTMYGLSLNPGGLTSHGEKFKEHSTFFASAIDSYGWYAILVNYGVIALCPIISGSLAFALPWFYGKYTPAFKNLLVRKGLWNPMLFLLFAVAVSLMVDQIAGSLLCGVGNIITIGRVLNA